MALLFWFFKLGLGQLSYDFALFLNEMLVVAVDLTLNLLFVVIYFSNSTDRALSFLPVTLMLLWLLRHVRSQVEAHISGHIMNIFNNLRVDHGSRIARGVALWSVIGVSIIVSVLDKLLLMLTLLWWRPIYASLLLHSSTSWNDFLMVLLCLRINLCAGFAVSYGVKIRWRLYTWSHVSCRARLGLTWVHLLAWT